MKDEDWRRCLGTLLGATFVNPSHKLPLISSSLSFPLPHSPLGSLKLRHQMASGDDCQRGLIKNIFCRRSKKITVSSSNSSAHYNTTSAHYNTTSTDYRWTFLPVAVEQATNGRMLIELDGDIPYPADIKSHAAEDEFQFDQNVNQSGSQVDQSAGPSPESLIYQQVQVEVFSIPPQSHYFLNISKVKIGVQIDGTFMDSDRRLWQKVIDCRRGNDWDSDASNGSQRSCECGYVVQLGRKVAWSQEYRLISLRREFGTTGREASKEDDREISLDDQANFQSSRSSSGRWVGRGKLQRSIEVLFLLQDEAKGVGFSALSGVEKRRCFVRASPPSCGG
ncbi:hypothetical protein MA16_Dca004604 [Dendrobium catenatum]|uniref:Uncharacterized protein n=1 Tax=Dendrobium catenatum TaxID=906689 RepID=A0A2I0VNK0_9ASPA|nr:hypothetical protein MA16_Dca004604 [Dendrobium catenatum]